MFKFGQASRIEQLSFNVEEIRERLHHFKMIVDSYKFDNRWNDEIEKQEDFKSGCDVLKRMNESFFQLLSRITLCENTTKQAVVVIKELSVHSEFGQIVTNSKCPGYLFTYIETLLESCESLINNIQSALTEKNIHKALNEYAQLFRLC